MIRKFLVMSFALAFVGLAACGDDEKDKVSNNANNTANNVNNTANNVNNTTGNNTNNTTGNNANNTNNGTNNQNNTNNNTTPTVMNSCDEAGLEGCFANVDCQAEEVCRDIGSTAVEVPCCIVGERGTAELGDVCEGEPDDYCASGVCAERNDEGAICSEVCSGPGECPDGYVCENVGLCFPL